MDHDLLCRHCNMLTYTPLRYTHSNLSFREPHLFHLLHSHFPLKKNDDIMCERGPRSSKEGCLRNLHLVGPLSNTSFKVWEV